MTREKSLAGSLILREEVVPGAFLLSDVTRHNQSRVSGSGPIDITTPNDQWAYAAAFPNRFSGAEFLLVRVDAEVHAGRVGIGCVSPDLQTYVATEADCAAEDGPTVLELPVAHSDTAPCGWLVVRNTAEGNQPSRATVRSIRTFRTTATRAPDLMESEACFIPNLGVTHAARNGSTSGAARTFQMAVTHSSRKWDWARCTREDMIRRYADPSRLLNLPPFDELRPPPTHLSSGRVSLWELTVDRNGARMKARRCIDSALKVQHVSVVGERLVLCFEDFLAVLPTIDTPLENVDLRPGSQWRIDDNWFSGLHTVFAIDDDVCLVSSSGADAVLWVDLRTRKVIRRWRLPSDIYGVNYDLTPAMSVSRHYIHNDIQLGHLNCAYPDGKGGCYISTLGQGDIGHVDEDGRYSLLARGYVGCHGVRVSNDGRDIYFSDSCSGRLMRLGPEGNVREWRRVDSRWLHDVAQADSDLYVFCLTDRNEVVVVDVTKGVERGRFAFDTRGMNVQFVSVTSR